MIETNRIYNMDCIEGMRQLEENSIDAIVTDPPYCLSTAKRFGGSDWENEPYKQAEMDKGGSVYTRSITGFMGKEWDNDIAFKVPLWKEAFRVLKPGGHLLSFGGSRTYHRMACAIEDAGFEVRDMIEWVYGCYSEDTEILTKNGWKKYYEVEDDDKILQWNHKNNKLSWVKPQDRFEYKIEDDMVLFMNRHTEQLVTQNHSVYAKIRKHSRNKKPQDFERIDAIDIKKCWQVDLPLAGVLDGGVEEPNAYVIGWWLTDAWVHNDKKACMFSQSKLKTLAKLRSELEKQDCKYSEYIKHSKNTNHNDEHTFYVTGKLANFLLKKYPDRKMTWDFLNLNYNSRMKLIEGLLDGDGSRNKDRGYSEAFWSKKKERLDIFQALCVSCNIRSHIDYKKGCVYLNRTKNTTQLQAKHKKPLQKYRGKVWCFQTKTGAFVVRRNGKAFISGNSGFPKSMNIGKAIDKKQGNEREIMGKDRSGGKETHKTYNMAKQGSSAMGGEFEITKGNSDWEGWGTALKPSHESIIVATKPLNTIPLNTCDDCNIIWELNSFVKIVEELSKLNLQELKEDMLNSVLLNVEVKNNILGNSKEVMDILQSNNQIINSTLNTVLSWKRIWEEVLNQMNISTISMEKEMITDLKTLKLLIGQLTLLNIMQVQNNQANGETVNVCIVENLLKGVLWKLRGIQTLSVRENAISKENNLNFAPNHEPIVLARKPLAEKTVAENVLKYGTGGINIDGCRIGNESISVHNAPVGSFAGGELNRGSDTNSYRNHEGRFPANFIHDGSEEVLENFPDNKGAFAPVKSGQKGFGGEIYGKFKAGGDDGKTFYGDGLGTAARFFYCAKASKAERNEGLEDFKEKEAYHYGSIKKSEGRTGINTPQRNFHPTIKPITLMRYLCRLITPKNGVVLDPFIGSGTTAIAAYQEGFGYIGFELEKEYAEIANARIRHYTKQKKIGEY